MSSTNSPGPAAPGTTRRRPTLLLIGTITVTAILANTLPNAGIPDILDDFGKGDSAAGLLVAAASIPGIVVAPLIGLLADRYGRRTILVPCLVLFGLCGLAGAFAPSYALLVVARFGQGIGSAGLINLANILIGDHWDGVDRTRIYGYNSAILTVSLAILPAIGGALTDLGGWRLAFAPYPLALVTAWIVLRRLEPGTVDRSVSVAGQLRAAAAVIRSPAVLGPVGLSFAAFVLIFGLFLTVLPVHLEDEFGMNATERGLVLAMPAIGATVGALALGRIRRRVGPRTIAAVSFGLFAVSYPVVGIAGAIAALLAAAVVYGLGEGLLMPTLTDMVAESAPERGRGAVLSVQTSAIRSGQTVGPLIGGAGMGMMSTGSVFVVGGVLAAVLCVVTAMVRLGRQ
ncbi:MAG: MFS transporter [Acidimicrobiia bacterium]|nr:MFS transporter [Acidimicrobiia bacterium]